MIYFSQLISDDDLASLCTSCHTGIELIDFSVGMNLDQISPFLQKWKLQLAALHHPPVTLHGPFLDLNPTSYDSLIMQTSWTRFHQAYEAAKYLSADKIIIHTCRIPLVCYAEGWAKRAADFWNRFLKEHAQIPIAVENVFDESPVLFEDFASQIYEKNFSICLDLGHANCFSNAPLSEWITRLSPWISHLHLHDNHGITDEHLALTDGNISWTEVTNEIKKLPHLKGVTLENTTKEDFKKSLSVCHNLGVML